MTQPLEAPIEGAGGPRRRPPPLLIGGAVALVAMLLVVLVLVSGGGDGGSPSTTTTPSPSRPRPGANTTTTVAGGPSETFEVFTTKNPFLPLRSAGGAAAPSPTGGAGAAPGAAQGGSATRPGSSTGGGGAGATSSASQGGGNEPRRGARVALQDVFVEAGRVKANVRVNDTVHKVSAGQVFATNFKVVSISQADNCGRFLFADDSFRLCRGEQVIK